jgi:hypothetical protein
MRAALIVQPTTIASGGGQILNIIGKVIQEEHDVDVVVLRPTMSNNFGRKLNYIKSWIKIVRSMLMKSDKITIMDVNRLAMYDRIYVGWVGDLGRLISGGIAPERIIHICQSVETWSNDTNSACLAYSLPIERWFVADWLSENLANVTSHPSTIGNAIGDLFFDDSVDTAYSSSHDRPFITYLTHPGWWKSVPESALASEVISKKTGLKIQTFGTFRTHREHYSELSPNPLRVKALLDRSKLFVAMSIYEGMPLIAIEALARGCKLVLSDIPAHREIWKNVGSDHCRLIGAPPLKLNELYETDWSLFLEKRNFMPDYITRFKTSAFRDRIIVANSASVRNFIR